MNGSVVKSAATSQSLKALLSSQARALGLDAVGVTRLDNAKQSGAHLYEFLNAGHHGDMDWMATSAERRADPLTLWPQARSAILVGLSYAPTDNPMAALEHKHRSVISAYAKGRDYHDVLKSKIKQLAQSFAQASGAEVKVFVDTAPLMEKPLAAAAGLGWQGKHTNLVSREHGSWLFLGAILTTAELQSDVAEIDHCGSCRRCLDVCPTDAFPAPYQLDARRCIAYLTIEHKGHIPKEFRKPLGNRVFGCDDCLAVCPWNKFANASREAQFAVREATDNPPLVELLELDDQTFRTRFAGTPVKRTGRNRIVRNALIASGNAQDQSLLPNITRLLRDDSPLIRAAAIWATKQLMNSDDFSKIRASHAPCEHDEDVADEWRAGHEVHAA